MSEELACRPHLGYRPTPFSTGTMGELATISKVDGRTIGDGDVGEITMRLSTLYAQLTAREGVQVV